MTYIPKADLPLVLDALRIAKVATEQSRKLIEAENDDRPPGAKERLLRDLDGRAGEYQRVLESLEEGA